MPIEEDLFDKLRIELRRGALSLAVLLALRQERYGYTLRQQLEAAGLPIGGGALYPVLRRLQTALKGATWFGSPARRLLKRSPPHACCKRLMQPKPRLSSRTIVSLRPSAIDVAISEFSIR